MAESEEKVVEITKHLMTRPIYPILENSSEKDDFTALQFMCIVDFYATHYVKLYDRIEEVQQPKLLGQLLQFSEFGKFKYFHYAMPKQYGNCALQCKYCPLVGPCGCILSHMAISHSVHTALKNCIFCNTEMLETHTDTSLTKCYSNYVERNDIHVNEEVYKIIANFYEMMKKLSQILNICLTRRKGYAGKGYKRKQQLSQDYGGDIAPECEVRYMISKTQINRTIRSETLDREFCRIMEIMHGGYFPRFALSDHSPNNCESVIQVDSSGDDDEEVNNITIANGQQFPVSYNYPTSEIVI